MEKLTNDEVVKELVAWLFHATDQFCDGDFDAEDLDELAQIVRKIDSNVEVPKDIWVY